MVIVESPAKARTVGGFLGSKYTVKATLGHLRDLPKSRLGVDIEDGFSPHYVVPKEKRAVLKEIKEAAKGASVIYLATDPDREGEAISWHVVKAAGLDESLVRRVTFHEITRERVIEAIAQAKSIDMELVNAQQARRVLDRLVGYSISPILWKKIRGHLSAGRVQSVALRMIVEREREVESFVPQEYWSIEAELSKTDVVGSLPDAPPAEAPQRRRGAAKKTSEASQAVPFRASLVGPKVDSPGKKRGGNDGKIEIKSQEEADRLVSILKGAAYSVLQVRKSRSARRPPAPFTTSTLQQDAYRKLRFTSQRTMAIAQQLYEGLSVGSDGHVGLITYMRTDSTRVADSAVQEAREYIRSKYGKEYLPDKPNVFLRKAK
ncbi:MAG: topoisomerase, partial [Dehalococcoidia bacterium]|nr:topoisomerase [Dehalococcoidia bacterium]